MNNKIRAAFERYVDDDIDIDVSLYRKSKEYDGKCLFTLPPKIPFTAGYKSRDAEIERLNGSIDLMKKEIESRGLQITGHEAEIESMKCCGNCKHEASEIYDYLVSPCKSCEDNSNWESTVR